MLPVLPSPFSVQQELHSIQVNNFSSNGRGNVGENVMIQGKGPGPQTFSSLYFIQKKEQSSFSSEKKPLIYTGRTSGIKDGFPKSSLKV